jgi:hypothetical protein
MNTSSSNATDPITNENNDEPESPHSNTIDINLIFAMKDQIEDLKKRIIELEKERSNNCPIINNSNNNTNNITQNVTQNNIILRNFGDENLDSFDPKYFVDQFHFQEIGEMVRDIHYNPKFPENKNIGCTETNFMKFVNGKWINSPYEKGIYDLIASKIKILERLYTKQVGNDEYSQEDIEVSYQELMDLKEEAKSKEKNDTFYKIDKVLYEEEAKLNPKTIKP